MAGTIEVLPQPRVDLLVDGADGQRRRMTEYTGIVWYGGNRPQMTGLGAMSMSVGAQIQTPWFVPDSLRYRPEALADAQLSVTVALANVTEHVYLFGHSAAFVADPSGAPIWIQVQIQAGGRVPAAFAYRVVALTSPDAVEPSPA